MEQWNLLVTAMAPPSWPGGSTAGRVLSSAAGAVAALAGVLYGVLATRSRGGGPPVPAWAILAVMAGYALATAWLVGQVADVLRR